MPASLSPSPVQDGHQREERKKSSFSDLRVPHQDPMTCNLNFLALLLLLVGALCHCPVSVVGCQREQLAGEMLQMGDGLWQPQGGQL